MKPEFYEAYRDLADLYRIYQRYPFPFPPMSVRGRGRDMTIVSDALESAIREAKLEGRLRPDAHLFLLVNVHHMVVLPLSFAAKMPSRDTLRDILSADIRTILESARHRSDLTDQHEISGHTIVSALAEAWQKLRITEFELWG